MPKRTASDKHRNDKSHLTSSDLIRPPIHSEGEEKGKYHQDRKDHDGGSYSSQKKIYPDLDEELEEIQKLQYEPEIQQNKELPNYTTKPEDEATKSSSSSSRILLYIISFIVLLLSGFHFFFQGEEPSVNRTLDLTKFISDMKNKFKEQDPQTFSILKSSLKNVFQENSKPTTPAIITVIANKGAEITASDFCAYIAQKLGSKHYVLINESVYHKNLDDLKYVIDTEIKSKFDNRSLNVAIVDKFYKIPIEAAMIFHNYCDHENAPFKRAIFFFIVHHSDKIPENANLKLLDAAAMETLRYMWRDTSDDMADSLITRLTVNVINIK